MSGTEFKDYVKYDLQKSFYNITYDDTYDLLEFEGKTLVDMENLDVCWTKWHKLILTGHPTFKFNGEEYVALTPENYEEFKQVVEAYHNVIDNFQKHQCCNCGTEDTQYYDDDGYSYCTECKNESVKSRIEDLLNI